MARYVYVVHPDMRDSDYVDEAPLNRLDRVPFQYLTSEEQQAVLAAYPQLHRPVVDGNLYPNVPFYEQKGLKLLPMDMATYGDLQDKQISFLTTKIPLAHKDRLKHAVEIAMPEVLKQHLEYDYEAMKQGRLAEVASKEWLSDDPDAYFRPSDYEGDRRAYRIDDELLKKIGYAIATEIEMELPCGKNPMSLQPQMHTVDELKEIYKMVVDTQNNRLNEQTRTLEFIQSVSPDDYINVASFLYDQEQEAKQQLAYDAV